MPTMERNYQKLRDAIEWSRRRLEPHRSHRLETIENFVGGHYMGQNMVRRVPLGFMQLALTIYLRHLAANAPSVQVTSTRPVLQPMATTFSLAINHLLKEINFKDSLQRWALDAMFSVGIMKVGETSGAMAEVDGFLHDAGQPYADPIDLDDWVHDMTAKRWEQIGYCGNRYVLPFEFVMDSKLFKTKEAEGPLMSIESTSLNEDGTPRVEAISRGDDSPSDGYYDEMIELWDVWLPRDELMVTFAATDNGVILDRKPLREFEWEGPEVGPYHRMEFQSVPNNIMPLPPTSMLFDLHVLANILWNKLGRQAERQKSLTVVQAGAEEDAERIVNANDGDTIRADNAGATQQISFGGIDQTNMAFFIQLKDLFFTLGGNLDALGGLGPQADTLGQEELIATGASQRIADWQEKMIIGTQSVVESLADYLWNDPLVDFDLVKQVEGVTNASSIVKFNEDMKEGDFIDYNMSIKPFSMQPQGPAEKLKTMTQVVERFVLPMMPFMEAQGMTFDMREFMKIIADYTQTPELNTVLKMNQRPLDDRGPVQGGGDKPRQSPVTKRTNVRVNRPGATREGKDDVMARTLLGGNPQQSEKASVGRPTG